jgi:hypothetical protein
MSQCELPVRLHSCFPRDRRNPKPLRESPQPAQISVAVRGAGSEQFANNANPAYNRELFAEAHDLAWIQPGEGEIRAAFWTNTKLFLILPQVAIGRGLNVFSGQF